MQYPDAVRMVNRLAPQMRDGDPAEVLLKAASTNELPVAVMEKLAQIWNSGRVLEDMASGNRGATIPLIDVDKLVLDYTKVATSEKAASAAHYTADDCGLPNFNKLIIYGPEAEQEKAAEWSAPAAEENYDLWESFVHDAYDDLRAKAAAWKRELIASGAIDQDGRYAVFPSFGQIEADAVRLQPFAVKAASWLTQHWSTGKAPVRLVRAEQSDTDRHKLAHDFTGQASRLLDISNALATAMSAAELFDTVKEAASAEKNKAQADKRRAWPPQDRPRPAPPRGGVGEAPPKEKPKPAPETGGVEDTPVKSLINYRSEAPKPKAEDDSKPSGGGSLVSQLLSGAATPYNQLVSQTVKRITNPPAQINTRQMGIDQKVRGLQEIAGLQKLMVSDPVISKADPQLVADLFSTIRRGSPEIATDPLLLKFQLREAIQYGGMPPDSFLQMQRIRGAEDDHRDAERRDTKAQYGFGGGGGEKKKD